MANLNPKRRRHVQEDKEVTAVSSARYLLITRLEEAQSFLKVNPFVIQSGLDNIAGPVKSCTRLRTGSLLVETYTSAQFEKLLKAKLLHGYPVRVEKHRTLNSSKGVITTHLLDGMPEEEILGYLSDQGVTSVYRVRAKREGLEVPTRTLFLTFDLLDLPQKIKAGYEVIPVRPYIPRPMRCFQCHRYGHTKFACKLSVPVCVTCSKEAHDGACPSAPCCVNCRGAHPASSRDCPSFLDEKAIQELRVKERLSFAEARKRHLARQPSVLKFGTFSSVVSRQVPKRDMGTQTLPVASTSVASSSITVPSSKSTSSATIPVSTATRKFKTQPKRSDFLKDPPASISDRSALKASSPSPPRRSRSQDARGRSRAQRGSPPVPAVNRFAALSSASGETESLPSQEPMEQESNTSQSPSPTRNQKGKLRRPPAVK